MAKKSEETETSANDVAYVEQVEPAEFPVTLDEFLSEIPAGQGTMKAGFTFACKESDITGHKLRSEWQALLTQYNNTPGDVPLRQKGGK